MGKKGWSPTYYHKQQQQRQEPLRNPWTKQHSRQSRSPESPFRRKLYRRTAAAASTRALPTLPRPAVTTAATGRSAPLQFVLNEHGEVNRFLAAQPIRTPFPEQRTGSTFMLERIQGVRWPHHIRSGLLLDGPRVGKCGEVWMTILADIQARVRRGEPRFGQPWLILAPKDALASWPSELQLTLGSDRLHVQCFERENLPQLRQHAEHFLDVLREETDVIMTTYSIVTRSSNFLADFLRTFPRYRGLVCDEAHNIRTMKGQGFRTIVQLQAETKWFVSGTPIHNNLDSLRAALYLIGISDEELNAFKKDETALVAFVQPLFLRRVNEFQEPTQNVILPWTSAVEQELYHRTYQFLHQHADDDDDDDDQDTTTSVETSNNSDSSAAFRLIHRLRGFCVSPYLCRDLYLHSAMPLPAHITLFPWKLGESLLDDTPMSQWECALRVTMRETVLEALHIPFSPTDHPGVQQLKSQVVPYVSAKERWVCNDWLSAVLDPRGEKGIIFSHWHESLERLRILLDLRLQAGVPRARGYALVHGKMTLAERREQRERFTHDPTCGVLLATIDVNKEGLGLTAANHAVLYEPWWNPQPEFQALNRICGPQQTRPVHFYRLLMDGTIDRSAARIADEKILLDQLALPPTQVAREERRLVQQMVDACVPV